MKKLGFIILFICWLVPYVVLAQSNARRLQEEELSITGTVKEEKNMRPIKGVEIKVSNGTVYRTGYLGDFGIHAKIGDQIIISHDTFNTIYYVIESGENIDVLVKDIDVYNSHLKQAKAYLKKDAATSIDYVRKALGSIGDDDNLSSDKKSELYEVLADIYSYWKQPDFAEDNYQNSLSNKFDKGVQIKLGIAQLQNENFEIALGTFNELYNQRLSAIQKVAVYDGLGDVYKGLKEEEKAIGSYNKALSLAKKKGFDTKVIALNSKLADVLQIQGNIREAENYLDNSVQLAGKKSKRVSARQRAKAADFYNKNSRFKKEIQLRKETLADIQEMEGEELILNTERIEKDTIVQDDQILDDRAITSQVQNYKIANAFVAQQDYSEALPYLKESIKKATSENDLVVQKDATRKLGEVYREQGELKKASEAFSAYGAIVDKLHLQKDQEISQANRFSRELAQKANRITTLEKDRELNESKYNLAFASQQLVTQQSQKQQILIYSLVGLTGLLLLAGYLMYRNMKQQQQANDLLALKSLRTQMNPHFIFNALNSVNTFIATSDERAANKYLTEFSLLMRAVLENSEEDFIPLEKEIELLELYVKLEHFRFQDKFDYELYVDPQIDVTSYMIPPMLLQPYIENAVWHGLRYKSEKGLLSIRFNQKDENAIEITVEDNGIGREKSKALKTVHQKKQKSKGMSNIKERINILNRMHKDRVDVFVDDLGSSDGTQVTLQLKKE